jgi:hypothetical protein
MTCATREEFRRAAAAERARMGASTFGRMLSKD